VDDELYAVGTIVHHWFGGDMASDRFGRVRVAYGAGEDQHAELWLPDAPPPAGGWPVAVLIHGGYWRQRYDASLMEPLADDLAGSGWAVWNLEFRRVRGAGGWPETMDDVAAGVAALDGLAAPLDLGRVVVVGHSAGGHLALLLAGRASARSPVLTAVVALAPVADLQAAHAAALSDHAARELLGADPDVDPERWRAADPLAHVGHGIPVLLVHGRADEDVPPAQSTAYAVAARAAGDAVTLERGSWDHLALIDPTSSAWAAARTWLRRAAAHG
jgi:acetyl esterase/lipase